jgi:hypothetical protein
VSRSHEGLRPPCARPLRSSRRALSSAWPRTRRCAVHSLKYASGLLALVDCSRIAAYGYVLQPTATPPAAPAATPHQPRRRASRLRCTRRTTSARTSASRPIRAPSARMRSYDQRVETFGEHGMATAHNQLESTVVVASKRGHLHPPSQWSFPQRYKHTYTTELAEFCALVASGGVEPDEYLSRHLMLDSVTAAAELSWRLGRAVRLEEVDGLRHVLTEAHAAHLPAHAAAGPMSKL